MNISEPTILKFHYALWNILILATTWIYKYSWQWVCIQRWHRTHTIRNMFDPLGYSFRFSTVEKLLTHLYTKFHKSLWVLTSGVKAFLLFLKTKQYSPVVWYRIGFGPFAVFCMIYWVLLSNSPPSEHMRIRLMSFCTSSVSKLSYQNIGLPISWFQK